MTWATWGILVAMGSAGNLEQETEQRVGHGDRGAMAHRLLHMPPVTVRSQVVGALLKWITA